MSPCPRKSRVSEHRRRCHFAQYIGSALKAASVLLLIPRHYQRSLRHFTTLCSTSFRFSRGSSIETYETCLILPTLLCLSAFCQCFFCKPFTFALPFRWPFPFTGQSLGRSPIIQQMWHAAPPRMSSTYLQCSSSSAPTLARSTTAIGTPRLLLYSS